MLFPSADVIVMTSADFKRVLRFSAIGLFRNHVDIDYYVLCTYVQHFIQMEISIWLPALDIFTFSPEFSFVT